MNTETSTITLNQYLTLLADCPPDFASQRYLARHAFHALLQSLADGGYPAHLSESFPHLKETRSRRHLTDWWAAFRAWLRTLTPRELRCLERELVLCPAGFTPPQQLPARYRRTRPRLRDWAHESAEPLHHSQRPSETPALN
jgi:hypothetical protein